MKKTHVSFIVLILSVLCIVPSAFSSDQIKIGAIFSVTGPASFLGEPEKNTALMIQEQINSRGGILGKKIEILVYDDESDVNKSVLAADKLLKKDKVVAVIGPTISGNTLAIMDKFEKAKIPLVSCAASEKIVKPVKPYIFNTPQLDRHAVSKIFAFMKSKNIRKVAILSVSDGYGQSGREVLKELAAGFGIQIVADEVYGPKDTDMTAQLTKIKGSGAGAIICWGTNPGPAVVAKNRAQLGIDIPLYMSHGVASKKFIELAGSAAEGILLPAGRLTIVDQLSDNHPQKGLLVKYRKNYESQYKTAVSSFGGYSADALMLVARAIETGKSASPESIRSHLEKITGFVGISGTYNYSPSNHNGLDENAFEMVMIEKGDWKKVK